MKLDFPSRMPPASRIAPRGRSGLFGSSPRAARVVQGASASGADRGVARRLDAGARPVGECSQGGFSLLELMMVLVMVAILLGVAAPSFQDSLQRNRLQSATSSIATALSFARAEAVIRAQPVSLCASVDQATCSGSNWETGHLVFVDNGFGTGGVASDGSLNGGEELLRIGEAAPVGVTVRTVNFPATSGIVFQDSGRVLQNVAGTVVVCDTRGATAARGIIVEVSGQGRRAVDADANGVPEDNVGSSLSCP